MYHVVYTLLCLYVSCTFATCMLACYPDTYMNSSAMFLILSPCFGFSPLPSLFSAPLPGQLQADATPLMSRGSAQGFFLSFSLPLSTFCLP